MRLPALPHDQHSKQATLLPEDIRERQRGPVASSLKPPLAPAQVSWRIYFEDFKRKHGQPVKHQDRWWFADGWSYATSFRGPEYPPPAEPYDLREAQKRYWRLRKLVVDKDAEYLEQAIRDMEEMRKRDAFRPGSLVVSVKVPDVDGDGKATGKSRRVPVDLDVWRARLEWLRADSLACLAKLGELEDR